MATSYPNDQYKPISQLNVKDRRMFVIIAIDAWTGNSYYTSDPVTTWRDNDGSFPRWKHAFPPTHFYLLPDPKNASYD